jgi:hypothetical protein
MKRILFILALTIVLIGIGVAVYFIIFASSPKLTVNNSGSNFSTNGNLANQAATKGDQTATTGAGTQVAPNLVEITPNPVAGGVGVIDIDPVSSSTVQKVSVASTTASSTTIQATPTAPSLSDVEVRYISRESGNVFAYRAFQRSLTRILNKTLPGIQEASWFADGGTAIVRYLEVVGGREAISTYVLPINGANGFFLQSNLTQAMVAGTNSLFTLATNSSGGTAGIASADGSGSQTLFTSPLSSLVVRQAGAGYMAVTRASSEGDGYVFSISSSGVFTPIVGPLRGLTMLPSPTGKRVLYSYTDGTNYHMSVLDLTTGEIIELPLATFAEKCVWTNESTAVYCGVPNSLDGNMPDDWYQGTATLADRIWRIDLTSRLATLTVDPSVSGKVDIDAVNLTLDPNQRVLVFRNKKDSSLWVYTL